MKKQTNPDLHQALARLMQKGSPLNTVIEEQQPKKQTKKRKEKVHTNPLKKGVLGRSQVLQSDKDDEDEDDTPIVEQFTFIFNNRPYEAERKHNTVILTDLETYQSSISFALWDEPSIQHLHDYLQRNWERIELPSTENETASAQFLIDDMFNIIPEEG